MIELWNLILYHPILNGLVFFYRIFGNLGVGIIVLTVLLYLLLAPLNIPSMKAAKKMAELAPEIEKLKKRHAGDKQVFARAQMDLYRQHKVNPAAGCLPMILQMLVLIALYQAFLQVLKPDGPEIIAKINQILYPFLRLPQDAKINLSFLWLDLAKPDLFYFGKIPPLPGVFLILAALTQLLSSKMMAPQVRKIQQEAKKTSQSSDDLAAAMQGQMLYLFPLLTIFIGYTFPSGLVLYWFLFSFLRAFQQYFTSGWGGLSPWMAKLKIKNEK